MREEAEDPCPWAWGRWGHLHAKMAALSPASGLTTARLDARHDVDSPRSYAQLQMLTERLINWLRAPPLERASPGSDPG